MKINCYVCRRVIMRYILYILSLAFLLLGSGQLSNEENLQRLRSNAGASEFSTLLSCKAQAADSGLSSDPGNDYSQGILTTFSLPRNITPSRTLNFNDPPTIVHLLSSRAYRLPEDKRKILFSDTNYLRYSNRYYIYTLAHLLI